MFEPANPELIAQFCPVVLLGQEFDMQRRQKAEIATSLASVTNEFAIVGITVVDGVPQPLVTNNGTSRSVRRIGSDDYDDRVTTRTPLAFSKLDSPYIVTPHEFLEKRGSTMSIIFDSNKAPITTTDTEASEFFLFQTYHPKLRTNTRGGFLGIKDLKNGPGGPIIVSENGNKYIVEAKGVGTAKGYFVPMSGSMEDIVLGGLPDTDALKEHSILIRASSAGLTPILPLASGVFPHSEQFGNLGVVFRLSPSTLRLSHKDIPGSIPIESKEDLYVVLDKLVTNFVTKFTQADKPIFLSPASHLENYLVHDLTNISETDFEDFRELGSADLPFVHRQTATFMDTRRVIEHYFRNFERLDLFDDDSQNVLRQMVEWKLAQSGVRLDLSDCKNNEEIVEKIWFDWLVDLEHDERKKQEYYPTDMFDYIVGTIREHNAYIDESATCNFETINQLIRNINDGDSSALPHKHFGYLTFALDYLLKDNKTVTNRERLIALEELQEELAELVTSKEVADALADSEKDESSAYINDAYGALALEIAHYTALFRLIKFTQSWFDSEAKNYNKLVESGKLQESEIRYIDDLSKIFNRAMESTDDNAVFKLVPILVDNLPSIANFYYYLYSD